MTSEQIELKKYLETIALKQKQEKSAFVIVTELEHWAEYDIHSVAQFEHYDAQATHYDFYKEIHGIRPRWMQYSKMTTEEILSEIKILEGEMDHMLLEEKKERDERSRIIQKRKQANSYKPNLAFSNLKELLG